jgi:hypothetical protein
MAVTRAVLAVAWSLGCSGSATPTTVETGAGSAASGGSAATGSEAASPATGSGDLQVHVEWHDVPTALRASPGRTACKTARPGDVAPSTTWGIPDVAVLVDAGSATATDARVVARGCELAPGLQVVGTGATLEVASAVEQPLALALDGHGAPDAVVAAGSALGSATRLAIQLPVIGHAVTVALADPVVDAVTSPGSDEDAAWVVAWPHAAAVTDREGVATLRGLPAGDHAIAAWLPPRAGQPARTARGSATVVAGQLADATLSLAP